MAHHLGGEEPHQLVVLFGNDLVRGDDADAQQVRRRLRGAGDDVDAAFGSLRLELAGGCSGVHHAGDDGTEPVAAATGIREGDFGRIETAPAQRLAGEEIRRAARTGNADAASLQVLDRLDVALGVEIIGHARPVAAEELQACSLRHRGDRGERRRRVAVDLAGQQGLHRHRAAGEFHRLEIELLGEFRRHELDARIALCFDDAMAPAIGGMCGADTGENNRAGGERSKDMLHVFLPDEWGLPPR